MLDMCGPECPKKGKHRELEQHEIRKSEKAVQSVISAIQNLTNPFEIADKDHLYNIGSGAPVTADVEADVLQAESLGRKTKETFIKARFIDGSSKDKFFDPNKRLKLKTMEACNKTVKLTLSDGKAVQYREQSDLAFMLLVKSQILNVPLDLDELMCYSLTPVPHCLGTADGFFAKTNKAKMGHYLLEDYIEDVPYPNNAFHIRECFGPYITRYTIHVW